jgi:hypothetical protein
MCAYCGVCRRKLRDAIFCRCGQVCCSVYCYRWHLRDWHAKCIADENKEGAGGSVWTPEPPGQACASRDG